MSTWWPPPCASATASNGPTASCDWSSRRAPTGAARSRRRRRRWPPSGSIAPTSKSNPCSLAPVAGRRLRLRLDHRHAPGAVQSVDLVPLPAVEGGAAAPAVPRPAALRGVAAARRRRRALDDLGHPRAQPDQPEDEYLCRTVRGLEREATATMDAGLGVAETVYRRTFGVVSGVKTQSGAVDTPDRTAISAFVSHFLG